MCRRTIPGWLLSVVSLGLAIGVMTCASIRVDWGRPISYGGDDIQVLGWIKAAQQGDYPLFMPKNIHRLNAPGTAAWHNYPFYEEIPIVVLGAVAKGTSVAFASNIGLILARVSAGIGFWVAAVALLRCRGNGIESWVGGFVFAMTYFHHCRGLGHLFLAFTWTIPLVVAVSWCRSESRWHAVVGLLMGLSGNPYWVLMGGIVIASGTQWRTWVWCGGAMAVGFITTNIDTLVWATGKSMNRLYFESELYALKPLELFLPPPGGAFGNLSAHYKSVAMVRGEMFSAYLGIVGIVAMAWMCVDWCRNRERSIPVVQTGVVMACAAIGGLGAGLSLCGIDVFRATNRWSIFISAIVLLYCVWRMTYWPMGRRASAAVCAVAVMAASVEAVFAPRQDAVVARAKYERDIEFGRQLEAAMPGAKLYSIPPMTFPDSNPVGKVDVYDNLRPWLHTQTVSFSYGQAANRLTGMDLRTRQNLEVGKMDFRPMSDAGYDGVIIVRSLFADGGAEICRQLKPVVLSDDFVVFRFDTMRFYGP